MPELRELVEMVRAETRPVPDAWEEQQRRQRRIARNRRIGAISLATAIAVMAVFLVLSQSDVTDRGKEANKVAGPPGVIPSEPGIYLFDLETKVSTRVGSFVHRPAFAVSPDGTTIAYQGTDATGHDVVYVANVDGTNARALEDTAVVGAPGPRLMRFSPDGTRIVYQEAKWPGDLFLVDVATGILETQLTHFDPIRSGGVGPPTFSPDGETVLFSWPSQSSPDQWDLWAVPVSGGEPRQLIRDAVGGHLSPDGQRIVYFTFSPEDPFEGNMWLADADGTNARPLVRGDLQIPSARWSPDGTKIAYAEWGDRDSRSRGGTFVLDLTTGETSKVLDGSYHAEWVDGHTWIVVPHFDMQADGFVEGFLP
jgi:Tol biopolymer transport system component